MTITHDMIQAASRARRMLGLEALARVNDFVGGRARPDGGFRGRGRESDLYYTNFALLALSAATAPPARTLEYLRTFADGDGLDLVHLGCLARCRRLARAPLDALDAVIAGRVRAFARDDGGFHTEASAATSSAYGCFIATGALEDLGEPLPRPDALAGVLETMRTPGGGFANTPGSPLATTPATAAATVTLHQVGRPVPEETLAWLLAQCSADGGFLAAPEAPTPDLLATAVALHALALGGVNLNARREACLDYLNSLWNPAGAFQAHWADTDLDVEYTFYGLLAAGALAHE
ncbi:MAG: hypothetical protein NTV86_15190 [Planctomycetota bacterium]|nr:hypothetical protein [Planctomycetota bacterium]